MLYFLANLMEPVSFLDLDSIYLHIWTNRIKTFTNYYLLFHFLIRPRPVTSNRGAAQPFTVYYLLCYFFAIYFLLELRLFWPFALFDWYVPY